MLAKPKHQQGFTLIELMITVAIVAILAAIAYPSYTDYVRRGYRSEGIALLNDAAAKVERFYAQNNTYAGITLAKLGYADPMMSATGKYRLTIPNPTATNYTVQVAPQGSQSTDTCGTLTIDQAGNKTPVTAECWR
ncbi:type IV pilin protein [Pseudomonas abietaniphila]|uniref:Type IV pilus assembly protein PilE n=1 Tax=Pseudomonas abietaniphila TaxID=89065 RepID=A0A1G7XTE5_9PSED|nr:type IV pilin protein [Pseudomonas abietaniphila]SDG87447.1 type IV pilus assembly protein PilE [Pseudomonas abietaniphila]